MKQVLKSIATLVALTACSSALAAPQVWDFNGPGSGIENNNDHGLGSGTYLDLEQGGVELVVSAWSSSGNSGFSQDCSSPDKVFCSTDPLYDRDPFIQRAELTKYSGGIGAINMDESDGSPHHAFDNNGNGTNYVDYDMALLQFDSKVILDEIDIGWRGDDSDITVLSYTGSADLSGNPFSSTDTWYSLLSQGWTHVGNYGDVSTSNNQVITGASESRYWLVGVYNPSFGNDWSIGNDAIKISGVTTSTTPDTQIPEPAGLALLLGGLTLLRSRKRRQ